MNYAPKILVIVLDLHTKQKVRKFLLKNAYIVRST